MKMLLSLAILCAMAAAGCSSTSTTKPADDESNKLTVKRPIILIHTTKGDIKAVLFPFYAQVENKLLPEYYYESFVSRILKGYYDKAVVSPSGDVLVEYVRFGSVTPGPDYRVEAIPRDVQPVRGTLCIMRLDSGTSAGIYADMRCLMIVRKMRLTINGQQIAPMRGTHFPIGQVIEGLDVMDKLGAKDSITSITVLPDVAEVSSKRLTMLEKGELNNFADVLSGGEPEPQTGAGSETAPPAGTTPGP